MTPLALIQTTSPASSVGRTLWDSSAIGEDSDDDGGRRSQKKRKRHSDDEDDKRKKWKRKKHAISSDDENSSDSGWRKKDRRKRAPTPTTAIWIKRGRRGVSPRRPARMTAQMTTTRRRRRRKRSSRSHLEVTTRNLAVLENVNPPSALPLPRQRLTVAISTPGALFIVLSGQKQYSSDGPRHQCPSFDFC